MNRILLILFDNGYLVALNCANDLKISSKIVGVPSSLFEYFYNNMEVTIGENVNFISIAIAKFYSIFEETGSLRNLQKTV